MAWTLIYVHTWLQSKLENGIVLFFSCDSQEGKNKEDCERGVVCRIGHRAFISLPFLLHILFVIIKVLETC